jgi:hypothetical protein
VDPLGERFKTARGTLAAKTIPRITLGSGTQLWRERQRCFASGVVEKLPSTSRSQVVSLDLVPLTRYDRRDLY